MMFKIGQKVCCVDDAEKDPRCGAGSYWVPHRPVKGCVYTVRGICPLEKSLLLEEIRNPERDFLQGKYEAHFYAWRFRPVVERKTSIEIFQRMLTPSRQKESAR